MVRNALLNDDKYKGLQPPKADFKKCLADAGLSFDALLNFPGPVSTAS